MSQAVNFAKRMVVWNAAVPGLLLAYDAWRGNLGGNPINFSIRTTGMLSLIMLVLSLAVTPLVRWAGWGWLGPSRRALGLFAFAYGLGHFLLFFGLDREWSLASTWSEIALRPYLAIGGASLLIMLPLAVTSTNGMVRALGGARWKQLHRLAYAAAVLGGLHYLMLVKADIRLPVAFLVVLAGLLLSRLWPTHSRTLPPRQPLSPQRPLHPGPTSAESRGPASH
ncbi:MAG: sulfite oxidase heme-binding subunit YedZ [Planctomycetaceae bacterium]